MQYTEKFVIFQLPGAIYDCIIVNKNGTQLTFPTRKKCYLEPFRLHSFAMHELLIKIQQSILITSLTVNKAPFSLLKGVGSFES